jgi:hypothetical protein
MMSFAIPTALIITWPILSTTLINYVIFGFPPPIGEVLSHKPTASIADS